MYTVPAADYVVAKADEEIIETTKHFNTKADEILPTTNLKQWFIRNVIQPIQRDMDEFQEKESGWPLRSIVNFSVHINKYRPLQGS